jgi:hypothetical protein
MSLLERDGLSASALGADGSGIFSDLSGFLLRLRKTNAPIAAAAMRPAAAPTAMPAIAPVESVEPVSVADVGLSV